MAALGRAQLVVVHLGVTLHLRPFHHLVVAHFGIAHFGIFHHLVVGHVAPLGEQLTF